MDFDQDIINGTTYPARRGFNIVQLEAMTGGEKIHIYVPTNQGLFNEPVPIIRKIFC